MTQVSDVAPRPLVCMVFPVFVVYASIGYLVVEVYIPTLFSVLLFCLESAVFCVLISRAS
jgi:hypothetical protein